jgi:uncharacterized protein YcbK (DUF882 family)
MVQWSHTMAERDEQERAGLNRRSFLGYGAVAAAAALAPMRASAATAKPAGLKAPVRTLSFFHTHTGERAKITYCCNGEYDPQALQAVNHLLRDFRVNRERAIDPALLDLLHELGGTLETDQPFHVISGYRAPETNAMLRERGGAHTGVASKSLHMVGKAIDIRLPGVKLDHLRGAARSLKLGGVGFYPSSNFVHVDTGRVRYW